MSVIVKGMDMPESCSECFVKNICFDTPFKAAEAFKSALVMKRPDFCLLDELPKKHGRLIERSLKE